MEASFISWRVEGEVGVLTLNRPQSRNALSRAVLSELGAHLAMLVGHSEVRALVIRGEGKMFCAGADIAEMQGLSPAEAESFARLGQRIFSALEQLPIPVVALVHGGAFGGGLELALACDIRFAATGTQFALPEVGLGINPGFGGTFRLPRTIGLGRALPMMLLGERIAADEALAYGLVSRVVPEEELVAAGMELAKRLAGQSASAVAAIKRLAYAGVGSDPQRAQTLEAAQFGLCFATPDAREGMAAFREKRKPEFGGSKPM
ncbi:3-hydroxybutyryl-CoA dehydratase [Alicyclobacillus hesperidum subsp. aegles]|uniref:enoyl-CoA hydratase/isomerase family protein n=1 Tax=Alicyclobacillus hesperidum TaxID=89784 RepID=UPI0007190DFF|nr:enoyl-CoA hydratase-related protein [Alicyclobacillus hesperidum]KRW92133.1 enoyl-CoA hydratase [Alicyclobacillus tengchongensis]GLG01987.1 3-hydroxybutyryl-CoA dehydratase [Alicyclobacillus hesperidum subsp. aegles]